MMRNKNNSYIVDYNTVDLAYRGVGGFFNTLVGGDTGQYAPAYLVTNEDLSLLSAHFNGASRDVLTVAASGDQPLFYAANGARRIDTFDITFCAKVVMDIKTAAIKILDRGQYDALLVGLDAVRAGNNIKITSVQNMDKVIAAMPADTAEFVTRMSDKHIFGYGITTGGRDNLSISDYDRLRALVNGPFNFIWSDIADVQKYLDVQYDIINVSNIFEWTERKDAAIIEPIVKSLINFLKPNGYIVSMQLGRFSCVPGIFAGIAKKSGNTMSHILGDAGKNLIVLQRTR